MYRKIRYNSTDVHVYAQEKDQHPRLLQHTSLYPLSYLRDENGKKPAAIINCSYFASAYVLGRNQGDVKNDTHDQNGFYDLVFLKDGSYKLGNFKSWDYCDKNQVLAGFSVATVLVKDGTDVSLYSSSICNNTKLTSRNPQTAVGVLKDGTILLIVSDGRTTQNVGLTGYELRACIKNNYPTIELLCQLDGGGSSELIMDGIIKNIPSDKEERRMYNGLALLSATSAAEEPKEEPKEELKEEVYETELKCPFKRMAVTQYDGGSYSHKGSDAWDITSGTAGVKDPYYAPCQLKCMAIDTTYAFTWWQSTQKVKFADGTIDYVTLMFGHDDVINAKVGMVIHEGTQVGNMGTGGKATGKMIARYSLFMLETPKV